MPSLLMKSIVASVLFAAGITAVISMFILMGRAERKTGAVFLRRLHKAAGFVFFLLMLAISVYCLCYVAAVGGQLSIRGAFHAVFALLLIVVLLMKVTIAQFYKQFLRFVPQMGMIVFVLAFVVYFTSAGFFFLMEIDRAVTSSPDAAGSGETAAPSPVTLEDGRLLFQSKCSGCHNTDSGEAKFGPSLMGILRGETLPSSGREATAENIMLQLETPLRSMPAFCNLTEKEVAGLLAYLETL